MFRSYELFKVLGIPIRVHGSFLLFLLIAGFLFGIGEGLVGFLATVLLLALVFGFVLLHELGHSVVALYHRIPVRHITLYPLGGIASLREMPREPRVEMQVAIAGPLVNFFLAGFFFLVGLAVPGSLIQSLVTVNLVLGLFNLLPGFPLDGGRILRAFLAQRRSYLEATRIAARVGQGVAIVLGVFGLLTLHFMLVMIAIFIFFTAQTELIAASFRSPSDLMQNFLKRVQAEQSETQRSYGASWSSWFPGVGSHDRVEEDDVDDGDDGDRVIELTRDGRVWRVTHHTRSRRTGRTSHFSGPGPSGFVWRA